MFKKQKAEDDAYNAQVKADNQKAQDDYNKAFEKYKQDLANYNKAHNNSFNKTGLSQADFANHLHFGGDKDAQLDVKEHAI